MEDKPKKPLTDLLTNPLLKTDSKFIQYSGLGVQLSGTILVFLFIGIWLDKYFETKFIFTLIFTFIGFFGGFYSFYLTIKNLSEEEKKRKEKTN
ncbi:MAG: AtpZ/AtpI family protein [Ignavibacteria bacterium]